MWQKEPSTAAATHLLDRAFGKPTEHKVIEQQDDWEKHVAMLQSVREKSAKYGDEDED